MPMAKRSKAPSKTHPFAAHSLFPSQLGAPCPSRHNPWFSHGHLVQKNGRSERGIRVEIWNLRRGFWLLCETLFAFFLTSAGFCSWAPLKHFLYVLKAAWKHTFVPEEIPQLNHRPSLSETTRAHLSWRPPKFLEYTRGPVKINYLSRRMCLSNTNGGIKRKPHEVGERDGVIIVDHGSRRKESNLMLNEFVTMFRDKTGYPIVEPAHMELAEPSIRDAFGSCVQQGANRVIDIPSLTAEAAKEHPRVSYIITAPLGLHDLLVDVVDDRIQHCLSHVAGDTDECSVCAGTSKCRLY
ncbi:hypothetical protein CIPAW_03G042000 [Carya illinoinensis]|uniref:Sirohydrochlorin ferrochelatase n=1 Tax=Carya illinoinensis TaxID=32201 RepID=A0A8T1R066_CARIL|nr:hypothetical protein CIPAW_03G042000 [Carya illinoinensis]